MLVSSRQVGVGEVNVAKLASELRMHLHEIQTASRNVASVERDIAEAEQVLGLVTAPSPYAEEGRCAATGHVLDGDGCILRPGFFERSRGPAHERPPRRRRVDDDDTSPDSDGQLCCANEGLSGFEPPGAAVEGRVKGEDGDAVLVRKIVEVGVLVGVPTLVGHDLHTVVAHLSRPALNPIQTKRVQRTSAEDNGGSH